MQTRTSPPFWELLRRHRGALGLTQAALAERAGLSVRAISDLERGVKNRPHRDTVRLLATALGLAGVTRAAFEGAARPAHRGSAAGSAPGRIPADTARAGTPALPTGGYLGALPQHPLVAREAELERIAAALEAVIGGQGRLLLQMGEPGVGKTRLAQEAMLLARQRGFQVLVGRCYEEHASVPLVPFVEVVAAGLAGAPALGQRVAERFPELGALVPDLLPPLPSPAGAEDRFRVFRAVTGLLQALGRQGPLAVLLDDLHWADSASIELLGYLARQLRGAPVLLLGGYRELEVGRQQPLRGLVAALIRERLVELLDLRPLTLAGTGAPICARFATVAASDEFVGLVHARSEGNPFFTEELLTTLVELGAIRGGGAAWERARMAELAVPQSVQAVVAQRVGRLGAAAQEVLRAASALGQEFDLTVLVAACGQEEDRVLDQVELALRHGVLEERRLGGEERYAFAHALIGQALYDGIPHFRRRRMHLRAGEALERLRGDRPEAMADLARHFLAADETERAIRYANLAGDRAAALYAHAEAVGQYETALRLLDAARDGAGAARVREKLGAELGTMGRYEAAIAVLEAAAAALQAAGDLERLGSVLAQIGWVYSLKGAPDAGLRRLQGVVAAIEALGPSAALAALYLSLADLLFATGHYSEYLLLAERVTDMAGGLGNGRMVATAAMFRGNALQMLGRVEEALQATEVAIAQAQEAGSLVSLYSALNNKNYMLLYKGDFDGARRSNERAVEIGDRLGDPSWSSHLVSTRNYLRFFMGEWAEAHRHAAQALTRARQLGEPFISAYALYELGAICLVEGAWADALRHLEHAATLAERTGDLQASRMAAGRLAELEVLDSRADAARARLEPLLDRPGLEEFDVTSILPVLAWAYLESGDEVRAERSAGQALRRARAADLRLVLVDALRVQALILIGQGRWAAAAAALEEGLALAVAMPYPYAEARLLHVYGALCRDRTEREVARERLGAALAIFQRLGARKDIERTEQSLAALG